MSTIRIPLSAPKAFAAVVAVLVAEGVQFHACIDCDEFVIELTGGV